MKHTAFALSSLSIALLFTNTVAADFKYDNFEIAYSQTSIEESVIEDTELKGVSIAGRYSINPNVAVGLSYTSGKADSRARFQQLGIQPIELEVSGPGVSVLYHKDLNSVTDYLVGASYNKFETEATRSGSVDIPELSGDGDSRSLFAGVRHQFKKNIEWGLRADFDLDAEDDDDEFSFDAQLRYAIEPLMDLGLLFSPADDGDTIAISFRKYF